jgi:hypothetical protein
MLAKRDYISAWDYGQHWKEGEGADIFTSDAYTARTIEVPGFACEPL